MIYFNDFNEEFSREVEMYDVPEILGISEEEFQDAGGDLDAANKLAYGFSFTEQPKYN
jgi:hypothetical protein